MAVVTRVGLGGAAAAYPGFTAKASSSAPQAAYVVDFLAATWTSLYFVAVPA